MKRAHEGLQNYLKSLRGPGEVASLTPNPRLPLGPDAPLPIGLRPIPTSSQRPKPTNATIVYARTAVADCEDLGRSGAPPQSGSRPPFGAPPTALSMREGDLVLTHRMASATRAPLGQNVKVISLRLLKEDLRRMGPLTALQYQEAFFDKEGHFKWSPDGVVNNLDGADPTNEFRDFAIANVALQGFVRFSTLPFGDEAVGHNFPTLPTTQKGVRNGDHVYLVFTRSMLPEPQPNPLPPDYKDRHTYQFGLALASHITLGKLGPGTVVVRAWSIGRVVDGNQSKNMVTLCVGVAPVLEKAGLTVEGVLREKWLDGRSQTSRDLLERNAIAAAAHLAEQGDAPPLPRDASWNQQRERNRELVGAPPGAPYTSALG